MFILLGKFIFESGDYVIYYLDMLSQQQLSKDIEVKEFHKYNEIPNFIKKELSIYPFINSLFHRIRSCNAILLSHTSDKEVISYGWVQSWKSFSKKFGWLYKDAVMLGPYGIHPDYRGLGYYSRLLRHSLTIADKNLPIVIFTSPENIVSQKGIEKIGFKKLGTYRIHFILRCIQFHNKIK